MEIERFKTSIAKNIFRQKYAQGQNDTWDALAERVVEDVCGTRWGTERALMSDGDRKQLTEYIKEMKFIPGGRYLYYCFAPGSKILKYDYTWESAENIKVGDIVVGFDEEIKQSKFKPATVTFVTTQKSQRYKVTTNYGSVIVSDSHQFVTKLKKTPKKVGEGFQWIKASDLVPGNYIAFSSLPWEVDRSYDAGWLSGIMDGEGTVSKGSISISQKPGQVLDRICDILAQKGIKFYVRGRDTDSVKTVYIRGRWESVKCLGMFRPIRLLTNWYKNELGSFWSRIQPHAEVITVEPYDVGEVVVIETSTSTLIGEGYLSHNCGRPYKAYNNCFIGIAREDTREEWAEMVWWAMRCLTTGGGIGIDYSIFRASGRPLTRTGGIASGPLPLMYAINEIGRNVMQGGSRRSAIYASLNWKHEDIPLFLKAKNWAPEVKELKSKDFNFPATLDMTNISVNYDDAALAGGLENNPVFLENCRQALMTAEPGFSFNFGEKQAETGRNACAEVTSADHEDVCNLGSVNLANVQSLGEFKDVITLATKFLVCGTLRADLPTPGTYKVREKNRRLGLGLMGIHEWLLRRQSKYEVIPELHEWLKVYRDESKRAADEHCERLFISRPVAYRAIAPTGTLGILASTSTGIEPLFAVAYKRRYLTDGTKWKYEYVVDGTADRIIKEYSIAPETIDTAYKLSHDYERRIKFQADIQDYVDMSISSTINLPQWGTKGNNESSVKQFAEILANYALRLRGFTCYPDGSRGGQPLTEVPYEDALKHKGTVFEEIDICEWTGKGGTCGV